MDISNYLGQNRGIRKRGKQREEVIERLQQLLIDKDEIIVKLNEELEKKTQRIALFRNVTHATNSNIICASLPAYNEVEDIRYQKIIRSLLDQQTELTEKCKSMKEELELRMKSDQHMQCVIAAKDLLIKQYLGIIEERKTEIENSKNVHLKKYRKWKQEKKRCMMWIEYLGKTLQKHNLLIQKNAEIVENVHQQFKTNVPVFKMRVPPCEPIDGINVDDDEDSADDVDDYADESFTYEITSAQYRDQGAQTVELKMLPAKEKTLNECRDRGTQTIGVEKYSAKENTFTKRDSKESKLYESLPEVLSPTSTDEGVGLSPELSNALDSPVSNYQDSFQSYGPPDDFKMTISGNSVMIDILSISGGQYKDDLDQTPTQEPSEMDSIHTSNHISSLFDPDQVYDNAMSPDSVSSLDKGIFYEESQDSADVLPENLNSSLNMPSLIDSEHTSGTDDSYLTSGGVANGTEKENEPPIILEVEECNKETVNCSIDKKILHPNQKGRIDTVDALPKKLNCELNKPLLNDWSELTSGADDSYITSGDVANETAKENDLPVISKVEECRKETMEYNIDKGILHCNQKESLDVADALPKELNCELNEPLLNDCSELTSGADDSNSTSSDVSNGTEKENNLPVISKVEECRKETMEYNIDKGTLHLNHEVSQDGVNSVPQELNCELNIPPFAFILDHAYAKTRDFADGAAKEHISPIFSEVEASKKETLNSSTGTLHLNHGDSLDSVDMLPKESNCELNIPLLNDSKQFNFITIDHSYTMNDSVEAVEKNESSMTKGEVLSQETLNCKKMLVKILNYGDHSEVIISRNSEFSDNALEEFQNYSNDDKSLSESRSSDEKINESKSNEYNTCLVNNKSDETLASLSTPDSGFDSENQSTSIPDSPVKNEAKGIHEELDPCVETNNNRSLSKSALSYRSGDDEIFDIQLTSQTSIFDSPLDIQDRNLDCQTNSISGPKQFHSSNESLENIEMDHDTELMKPKRSCEGEVTSERLKSAHNSEKIDFVSDDILNKILDKIRKQSKFNRLISPIPPSPQSSTHESKIQEELRMLSSSVVVNDHSVKTSQFSEPVEDSSCIRKSVQIEDTCIDEEGAEDYFDDVLGKIQDELSIPVSVGKLSDSDSETGNSTCSEKLNLTAESGFLVTEESSLSKNEHHLHESSETSSKSCEDTRNTDSSILSNSLNAGGRSSSNFCEDSKNVDAVNCRKDNLFFSTIRVDELHFDSKSNSNDDNGAESFRYPLSLKSNLGIETSNRSNSSTSTCLINTCSNTILEVSGCSNEVTKCSSEVDHDVRTAEEVGLGSKAINLLNQIALVSNNDSNLDTLRIKDEMKSSNEVSCSDPANFENVDGIKSHGNLCDESIQNVAILNNNANLSESDCDARSSSENSDPKCKKRVMNRRNADRNCDCVKGKEIINVEVGKRKNFRDKRRKPIRAVRKLESDISIDNKVYLKENSESPKSSCSRLCRTPCLDQVECCGANIIENNSNDVDEIPKKTVKVYDTRYKRRLENKIFETQESLNPPLKRLSTRNRSKRKKENSITQSKLDVFECGKSALSDKSSILDHNYIKIANSLSISSSGSNIHNDVTMSKRTNSSSSNGNIENDIGEDVDVSNDVTMSENTNSNLVTVDSEKHTHESEPFGKDDYSEILKPNSVEDLSSDIVTNKNDRHLQHCLELPQPSEKMVIENENLPFHHQTCSNDDIDHDGDDTDDLGDLEIDCDSFEKNHESFVGSDQNDEIPDENNYEMISYETSSYCDNNTATALSSSTKITHPSHIPVFGIEQKKSFKSHNSSLSSIDDGGAQDSNSQISKNDRSVLEVDKDEMLPNASTLMINSDELKKEDTTIIPYFNFYTEASKRTVECAKRKNEDDEDIDVGSKRKKVEPQLISSENSSLTSSDKGTADIFTNLKYNTKKTEKIRCENVIVVAYQIHKKHFSKQTYKEFQENPSNEDEKLVEKLFTRVANAYIKEGEENEMDEVEGKLEESETDEKYEEWTSELLETCMKALKCISDQIIVDVIIDTLYSDEDNPDLNAVVPLTDLQKKIIMITYKLCCDSAGHPNMFKTLMYSMKQFLLMRNAYESVDHYCSYVRFLTVLCRRLGKGPEMRWFIYDTLYLKKLVGIPMVFTALCMWPSLLPLATSTEEACPLALCTGHVLLNHTINYSSKQQIYKTDKLQHILKRYYGYKETNPNDVFNEIMKKINVNGAVEAITLLCKRAGKKWTLSFVVRQSLMPVLKEWETKKTNRDAAMIAMRILGYIMRPFLQGDNHATLNNILRELGNALADPQGDENVQEVAAMSICQLSKANMKLCAEMLVKWKPRSGTVSKELLKFIRPFIGRRKPVWWQSMMASHHLI